MATRVIGLDRLNRKLKALPQAAADAVRPVMEKIAGEMVSLAKGLVPVEYGDLKASIDWTWGEAPKGSIVLGKVKRKQSGNLVITIFAGNDKAFYARWVEFGTSPHINGGIFAGSKHPGTRGQPFFYPAWRAIRKSAKSRIGRSIGKSARKVAQGG